MPKLNQINALVTGRKSEAEKGVGDIYKILQKPELFVGMEKTYSPYDENGERLPPESKKVMFTAEQTTAQAKERWSELWNLVATQDAGNQKATAHIVVDGRELLADVPVTTLLFLEKQVNDLETFVSKLPTPDPVENWRQDPSTNLLKSDIHQTVRSKKEPACFVKYEATKEHPAQVEYYMKDVGAGTWQSVFFSGALPQATKDAWAANIRKLKDAIKLARENANMIEVEKKNIADALFAFAFA